MPNPTEKWRSSPSRAGLAAGDVMATLVVAVLAATCSRAEPGLWDGSFGTGSCSAGATGQFTCTPDRGSQPANCGEAEKHLELFALGDFTQASAAKFYVYVDKSGTGKITSFDKGWEPTTHDDPSSRCADRSTPRALHMQGGPFYGWGGGFGTSAKDWDSSFRRAEDVPEYLRNAVVDAGGYEGIAVWARRGPDSQGGVRVLVGDINTDDDISYLMYMKDRQRQRNCERVRECGCTNHKACQRWDVAPLDMQTPNLKAWRKAVDAEGTSLAYQMWSCTSAGSYCEDPAADTIPGYLPTGGMTTRCNTCAETRCEELYEAYPDGVAGATSRDDQFNGRPCTPHTFRSGVSGSFCFHPEKDPPPAEQDEQCGDHWTRPIYLTAEWQLHLVPFSEMLQQGWAKRFAKLDTRHVTVVRLTWDGGYIDYWIGWFGFYRRKGA